MDEGIGRKKRDKPGESSSDGIGYRTTFGEFVVPEKDILVFQLYRSSKMRKIGARS